MYKRQTSLCADVCYLPDVDTALVELPANSTMDFYYYFYTTVAGTGYTRVGFRNESNSDNNFIRNYWAVANVANGLLEPLSPFTLSVTPNPATESIRVNGGAGVDGLRLLDAQGREVLRSSGNDADVSSLSNGAYSVQPIRRGYPVGKPLRFIKQ